MSGRMTAEEWHARLQLGDINHDDTKYILWDWQNDRIALLKRIEELEKENDQLVELAMAVNEKVMK